MSAQGCGQALADFNPAEFVHHAGTFGVYIHVPFCLKKCAYCSFFSVAGKRQWYDRYVEAIAALITTDACSGKVSERRATTIFFGGGTPSMLPPAQLVALLHHCLQHFSCEADSTEISIEVNPATIDFDGLVCLRRGGFNRLSLGVQSFVDTELTRLGRAHTAAEALATFSLARKAGFNNLSLDLMYGLPDQNLQSWQQTLNTALELEPDHLSMYELTLEAGTPFFEQEQAGKLHLPEEEDVLAMMAHSRATLKHSDLARYEISNYAVPGYACRHNVNYWNNGSYQGYGPGAVSCMSGERTTTTTDVERFCLGVLAGHSVVEDREVLLREHRFRETVVMGLRMVAGVSLEGLEDRFGYDLLLYYGETLDRLLDQHLLEINRGNLCLTSQGLLLANTVMSELV